MPPSVAKRAASLLDWIYPPKCALCGLIGEPPICDSCRQEMPPHVEDLPYRPPLSGWNAVFGYESRASQAVRRLKYESALTLAQPMAEQLLARYLELGLDRLDWVVPVPIHSSRKASRGFNQAELLCESLPLERVRTGVLKRTLARPAQARLGRQQRLANLDGAFESVPIPGATILLVDDVATTGSTLAEAAACLIAAGAKEVAALVYAYEP